MRKIKAFFKELKRVKWPTGKEGGKTFATTVIFVSVAALVLFGVALAMAQIWGGLGVGV